MATAFPSRPRRVLVVDDEALIRWSIEETLADRGYVVSGAGTASEALHAASNDERFDVILLDVRLPDSSDLRLLGRLHALMPAARIIMMTAQATPELVDASAKLGAAHCVGKPFHLDDLAALVAAA